MMANKITNQYTGVYRTKDPIENFRFRVTLKKLYSIIKIPKFDLMALETTSNLNSQSNEFEEQKDFHFQKKQFSEFEFNYFSQKENCKTDTDKKYYNLIKNFEEDVGDLEVDLKERMKIGKIFSYTVEDKFTPSDQFGDKNVKVTKMRLNVENLKKEDEAGRNEDDSNKNQESDDIFFHETVDNLINHEKYSDLNNFETMYICADLDPTTLLFIIKYRKQDGLLLVYPDFNKNDENPYLLKIDKNSKQLFHFTIENLSRIVDDEFLKELEDQKREEINEGTAKLVEKLSKITMSMKNDQDFKMPKYHRVLMLLEVVKGQDFEYDNIHVQFEINLPKYVKVVEGIDELVGSTHSSLKYENSWNFGHCHCLTLDIEDELDVSEEDPKIMSINFDIISIDRLWQRERREGLTQFKVSLEKSLICEKTLKCYRDLQGGNKFQDFLERFFLGGIYENSFNKEENCDVLNRYGNPTISTGTLQIKVCLLKQVKPSLVDKNSLKYEINQNFPTIDDVIDEYRKAKEKLEKSIEESPGKCH